MRQAFLQYDVELLSAVSDPRERSEAIEALTAERIDLVSGERLDAGPLTGTGVGLLILSGILARMVTMDGRACAELIGPEDLVSGSAAPGMSTLSVQQSWLALTPCRIACLDHVFAGRMSGWPELAAALIERARRPGERAAVDRVIAGLPTIEVRLLASLWNWATWWAVVSHDGVHLTIPLSHERLGQLVGARRPTVTTAVGRLREAGYMKQDPDGSWRLLTPHGEAPQTATAPITAPRLEGMPALKLPSRRLRPGRRPTNPVIPDDLWNRLLEQREILRVGNAQRQRLLSRLRQETGRLRAITGTERPERE